jgi:hypothetical protein
MTLYTTHDTALTVLYGDIERLALDQAEAFVGTPGTVIERTNAAGYRYYAHKANDAESKARERYLAGPVGSTEADAVADRLRERIREINAQVSRIKLLGREGYALVDARAYATIAALHNHGVFAAGGMLVGSHAYGAVLNRLGVRAAAYKTYDVDIARHAALDLHAPIVLLDVLRESGLELFEVPQLDRKAPPTSYKLRGREVFRVDLLAPSRDASYPIVRIPELGAHATGLPLLGYLLEESQRGIVMYREGVCAVRMPVPERFAIHKVLVSQLRAGDAKSRKDLEQAATLAAAVADLYPGALATARAAVPRRAAGHLRKGLKAVAPILADAAPNAWDELGG